MRQGKGGKLRGGKSKRARAFVLRFYIVGGMGEGEVTY